MTSKFENNTMEEKDFLTINKKKEKEEKEEAKKIKSLCCKKNIDPRSVRVALQIYCTVFMMLFCASQIIMHPKNCNESYFSMLFSILSFWLGSKYTDSKSR